MHDISAQLRKLLRGIATSMRAFLGHQTNTESGAAGGSGLKATGQASGQSEFHSTTFANWSLLRRAARTAGIDDKTVSHLLAQQFVSRNLDFFDGLVETKSASLSDVFLIWQHKLAHFRGHALGQIEQSDRLLSLGGNIGGLDRIAFQTYLYEVMFLRSDSVLESVLDRINFDFFKTAPARFVVSLLKAIDNSGIPTKTDKVARIVDTQTDRLEFEVRMLDFVPMTLPAKPNTWRDVFDRLLDIAPTEIVRQRLTDAHHKISAILADRTDLVDLRNNATQRAVLRQHIQDCLLQGEGCSLIRLCDGESYAFGHSDGSQQSRALLEMKEKNWCGRTLSEERRNDIQTLVREAVVAADVLGVPSSYRLARDLPMVETLPTQANGFDFVTAVIDGVYDLRRRLRASTVVEDRVHQFLYDRDWIDELILASKKTVIISSWNEGDYLKPFPRPCQFIKLLGEPKNRRSDERGYHLIDELELVRDLLTNQIDEHCLVLLGGGIVAKHLAVECAKKGAVALDVGATLDYWTGRYTRDPAESIR